MPAESKKAVVVALLGNFAVGVAKFTTAAASGNSALFSEGIHSLVDTADQGLLMLGLKKSAKPPDAAHPLGYGHELYFWAMLVSVIVAGVGGGVTIYEGITRIRHPEPLGDAFWVYVVLGISALFEGASLVNGWRQFGKTRRGKPFWRAVRESKDPTVFMVVFEDSAALAGLATAALGTWLAQRFHLPALEGAASVVIGMILTAVAILFINEIRGLLVGESADPKIVNDIRHIAGNDEGVDDIHNPVTMYLGPETVLLAMEVRFRGGLSARQVGETVDRIEKAVQERHPEIKHIYIEADALRGGDGDHDS